MKYLTLQFSILALFCIFSHILSAQDYEIRTTHQGSGLIAVEARFVGAGPEPVAGTDAFLDFTIDLRWPAAANLDMGVPNNTGGYGISKAGTETVDGSDEYQGYQLSVAPLFLPVTWTRDTWIEIFTIQSNSNGSTGETIVVGAPGSNPFNSNIPNFNMSGLDFVPTINGSASLPVELSAFEAHKKNETSSLVTWSTVSELNTAFFMLERSTDARSWIRIAKLHAAGNSNSQLDYLFLDENIPLSIRQSGTVYYRLKVIDFDGYAEYSSVEAIEFKTDENKLIVYPNPTRDFFNLETEEEITAVEVYNSQGKKIIETNATQVNLEAFPSGIYSIIVKTTSRTNFTTVIKAE